MIELSRRKFLLGSTAMVAAAALPSPSFAEKLYVECLEFGTAPEEYYCFVHPRVYAIFNDSLMYWSDGNDPGNWNVVGEPLDQISDFVQPLSPTSDF